MGTGTLSSPLLTSFRESYRDLLRYLAHRTGSADEARDVAHDTWVRLADMNLRGEQPALCDGEARAYVFAMARNLVIDRQRHAGVVARHAQTHALQQGGIGGMGAAGHVPDACESLMYRQAVDVLEAALATVPDRARQVFLRHRVNGEDQGALAAEYGISRNMVERDMMLAMDRVQAAMEQWHAAGRVPEAAAARRTGRRRSLAALLGMAGVGVAGGLSAWRWWRLAVADWQQVASTGHGKTLRQPLPDGSHITLDAQSRVHMAYYAGQRRVTLLAGAAFFDVERDADRPFVVDVPADANGNAVRVTVLGTRFGVELGAGGLDVQVQVEEGRVRVQSLGPDGQVTATQELADGEALRVLPGKPLPASHAPTQGAAAWRHGVVAFTDTPLADAVERLRRYLPRAVSVDANAAALRLSGQVRIAQAEDFVRALPAVVPVQVRLVAGQWQVQAR